MQTLYTKLTRERAPQFQQSTKIVEDNGKRLVIKEPLTEECNDHIRRMSENYTFFKNKGIENLCPLDYKDGKLFFTFLKGKSFCDELLLLAEQKNREKFVEKLMDYKKFVMNISLNYDVFYPTEEFKNVFGEMNLSGKTAARKLNIDLIFENIIHTEETYQVIDYEWIFDFLIPYEFVFFRAINSFYIKYSKDLDGFISKNSIYDLFGIKQEDIETYLSMDCNFLSYVYGSQYNYDSIIHSYKKAAYIIDDALEKLSLKSQLYYDTGSGFLENQCITKFRSIKKFDKVDLIFEIPEGVKRLRFDPADKPVLLDISEMFYMEDEGVKNLEVTSMNACAVMGKLVAFDNVDPQMIFYEVTKIKEVHIKMRIITDDLNIIEEFNANQALVKEEISLTLETEHQKYLQLEELYLKTKKMNNIYLEIIESLKQEAIN